jgi:hypothetical protein
MPDANPLAFCTVTRSADISWEVSDSRTPPTSPASRAEALRSSLVRLSAAADGLMEVIENVIDWSAR